MARINLEALNGDMGNESSKTRSKAKKVTKEPVEYINGKGWVDEDGNVVEAETGKARNRRALELVDNTMEEHEAREKEERDAKAAEGSETEGGAAEEVDQKSKVGRGWTKV